MAVPKRKTSPSKRGMRRSADALKRPTYVEDKDSGELRRPHHIDLKTGMYRGRQILKAKKIICIVPDARKAKAVKACFDGEISPLAPASILRTHAGTTVYLDQHSAVLLSPATLDSLS